MVRDCSSVSLISYGVNHKICRFYRTAIFAARRARVVNELKISVDEQV